MAETIYQVVTMNGVQYYTRKQFDKKYPKQQSNTNQRLRDEIRNAPVVRELLGPMWGGTKDGKNVVRYEDADTYKRLSETKERIKSKANINLDFISEVTVDDMALTDNQKKGWLRELVYDLARLAKISPTAFVITDINVNSSGSIAAARINPTKSASFDIVCKSEGINTRGDEVEWSYKFSNGVDKIDNLEKDEAVILFGNLVTHSVFDYKEPLKIKLDADTVGEALKADLEGVATDFIHDCLKKLTYAISMSFSDISNGGIDTFIHVDLWEQDGEIFVIHPKYGTQKVQKLRSFYESIKTVLSYDRNIDCAFRIVPPKIDLKRFGTGKIRERVLVEFRT